MENLRALRKAKGLTLQQLGELMGVGFSIVGQWERGAKMPNASKLPKLAQILGCSIDDLFGENERKETA